MSFTVNAQNLSPAFGNIVIFQRSPGGPNASSLAWMSRQAAPQAPPIRFSWNEDFSFVWAPTGQLVPGALFRPAQILPGDPGGLNQVTLESQGGAIMFGNPSPGGQPGALTIQTAGSVLPGQASVGIGMANQAALATPAQPGLRATFPTSPIDYWIALGNFQEGQVLDQNLPGAAKIPLPPGGGTVNATFQQNGQWTFVPQ